ncbi:MAG: hypothetical protein ACE5DY_02400 [Mariprofundaceae bacterium]
MATGKVEGMVSFENTSPDVTQILIANSISTGQISIFSPENITAPSASASLNPVNILNTGNNYFTAANYANMKVAVDSGGSTFFPEASIGFKEGGSYRFGSRTGPLTCSHVMPTDNVIGSKVCNLTECAALAHLSLHLNHAPGASEALAGLNSDVPVTCSVSAMLGNDVQATSKSYDFKLNELQSQGGTVEFLVRGNDSSYDFKATCKAQPLASAHGYILNGNDQVEASATLASATIATCGGVVSDSIDISVDRGNTGSLSGYFDISGYDEMSAMIHLTGSRGMDLSTPTDAQTEQPWAIANIPSGNMTVVARANIDGNAIIEFPRKHVNIIADQSTDIGATFVARPVRAEGIFKLLDPAQSTNLNQFISYPFSGADYNSPATAGSYVIASDQINNTSGLNLGYGRLIGDYDTQTKRVDAYYQLLIANQSPINGALDGNGVLPLLARANTAVVKVGQSTANESLIRFTTSPNNLNYWINTTETNPSEIIQLPEESICFGQVEAEFSMDPAFGSIYGPELLYKTNWWDSPISIDASGAAYPPISGSSFGMPRDASQAGQHAIVSAVLPEGYQYNITPKINLVSATPDPTDRAASLPTISIPQTPLGCSQVARTCLQINAAGEDYTSLDISTLPTQPYCQEDANIKFTVNVNSGGANVDYVQYTVDGGNPAALCVNCGPDPDPPFELLQPLSAGNHVIEISAGNTSACTASFIYPFRITAGSLNIEKPPGFTVFLNHNETEIPASDPRIADKLDQVYVTGGCGLSPAPEDNRDKIIFDEGDHKVTFTLPGAENKTSTVSIKKSKQQLAYLDGNYLMICRIEDGSAFTPPVQFINPKKVVYDSSGERIAILQSGGVFVRNADDPTSSFGSFSGNYVDVVFRPGNNAELALVEEAENQYRLRITSLLQDDYLSDAISISGSQEQFAYSPPRIAWTQDGTHIAVAYDRTSLSTSSTDIYLKEWVIRDSAVNEEGSWSWHYEHRPEIIGLTYLPNTTNNKIALATTQGTFVFQRDSPNLLHEFAKELSYAAYGNSIMATVKMENDNGRLIAITDTGEIEGPAFDGKGGPVAVSRPIANFTHIAHFLPGEPSVNIYRVGSTGFVIDQTCSVATSIHRSDSLAFRPAGQ